MSKTDIPEHRHWNAGIMKYLESLRLTAKFKEDAHEASGHHFRKLDIRWGLPSVLVPAVFAPFVLITGYATNDTCNTTTWTDYVASIGLLCTSIFTGIAGYYQHGTRSAMHYMYSGKYADIITDIDAELIKETTYRMDANVFLTTMKMKYSNLVFGEPVIPPFIKEQIQCPLPNPSMDTSLE